MIEVPTLLVLGAGASAPFGFPTGQGLKDRICDPAYVNATKPFLASLNYDVIILDRFVDILKRSGRSSVDAFLESRQDYVEIGKLMMANVLLECEKTDALFENSSNRRQGSNWYDLLFSVIADGIPFEQVGENLNVITFNYDRSLEHYLFTALQNSYHTADEECAARIAEIPIIHVHGSLGRLPWQDSDGPNNVVRYDSGRTHADVTSAAQSVEIIPEATPDTAEFQRARKLMEQAKRILFLGFGFHPANLKRLMPKSERITDDLWGTSDGLSVHRRKDAARWRGILAEQHRHLIRTKIYDFLHNHVSLSGP